MVSTPDNPFAHPDGKNPSSNPFKTAGSGENSLNVVFAKYRLTGAGRSTGKNKSNPEDTSDNNRSIEEFLIDEEAKKDQDKSPKPESRLFNPKWAIDKAFFNEKIRVSVECSLSSGIEHLTRVEFTSYAILENGKHERIESKEGHLKNGTAEADLMLWIPDSRDEKGKLVEACKYLFRAKHRESAEILSAKLPVTRRKSRRETYEERLRSAVEKLKGVGFGRAGRTGNFDNEDWELDWERDYKLRQQGQLKLKRNKIQYPDAIIKIVEHPDLWSLDCFEFVQVCNLYALIDPERKTEFNSGIEKTLSDHQSTDPSTRALRTFMARTQQPFESTGLAIKKAYFHEGPQEPWFEAPSANLVQLNIESLLKLAPIGSRVSWSVCHPDINDAYRVENTLKLGNDRYYAHPLSTGTMSRSQVEKELAVKITPNPTKKFIEKFVFISDVAFFEVPEN